MQVIDLFAGIGGFSLAAHKLGWETICFCEIGDFACKVLKKNFPGIPVHKDIRTLNKEKIKSYGWEEEKPTIITGGFPCQPFSTAGKRSGTKDDRYLWPEMLRIIKEIKPKWIIGENVTGILTMDNGDLFNEICLDLENQGYKVETFVLPAISKGAPHRRDRVWITANTH